MPPVQLGFCMPTESLDKARRASFVRDLNRALDVVGGRFHGAWAVDHLQFGDADVLESFTTLAYVAALHPGLAIGHAVLCQPFRNPALVAKMAATLQFLTGGRYLLGVGAGWHEEEHRAYGYGFPTAGARVEQLDEALRIVKALWSQESVTFAGRHHRVEGARCEPRPDPVPPVVVGAVRPRMLRLAARHADWWMVSSLAAEPYRRLAADFAAACGEVGRDPATVRRVWCGGCACAPSLAEAERFAAGRNGTDDDGDFDFVGTPAQVVAQMRPFVDEGVDYFVLDCGGFPALTTLRMLAEEVLPALEA
jgi:alkanesulfonate monooxygenase SsuD/methylene tetrahydromethanopterin reductase-like flavin-dependent oxidoreductase (luciferase family)